MTCSHDELIEIQLLIYFEDSISDELKDLKDGCDFYIFSSLLKFV